MKSKTTQARVSGTLDPIVLQALDAGWFLFEYKNGDKLPAAAQMINGEWWCPRWGCDSMQVSMASIVSMLQNKVTLLECHIGKIRKEIGEARMREIIEDE